MRRSRSGSPRLRRAPPCPPASPRRDRDRARRADRDGVRARRAALRRRAGRARCASIKNGDAARDAVRSPSPSTPNGERGLLGVAFDPDFATNRFVYVYYTATTPTIAQPRQPLHRRRATSPCAGSERVLLDLDPLSAAHQPQRRRHPLRPRRQALRRRRRQRQRRATRRRSTTCSARSCASTPTARSRPTTRSTTPRPGSNRAIWALGPAQPVHLRLPARHRPDVHQRRRPEHLGGDQRRRRRAELRLADHRGHERATRASASPLYAYAHGSGTTTGLRHHRRRVLQPAGRRSSRPSTSATTSSPTTATAGSASSIRPTGHRHRLRDRRRGARRPRRRRRRQPVLPHRGSATASVYRVTYTASQAPTITHPPASQTVSVGPTRRPSPSRRAATPPLSYQWQRNGVEHRRRDRRRATRSPRAQAADNGARSASSSRTPPAATTSNEATLTVTANQPPTATITAPAAGTHVPRAATDHYAGTGTDPEDGTLAGAPLHLAGRLPPRRAHATRSCRSTSGATSGSFTVRRARPHGAERLVPHPPDRDRLGRPRPRRRPGRDAPHSSGVTARDEPDRPAAAPRRPAVHRADAFTGVVGIQRPLEAASPQTSAHGLDVSQSWSDGGARQQTISRPPPTRPTRRPTQPAAARRRARSTSSPPPRRPSPATSVDTGAVYGTRQRLELRLERQQQAASRSTATRASSPDQRYDTLIQMQNATNPNASLGARRPERAATACASSPATRRRTQRLQDQRRGRSGRSTARRRRDDALVDRTQTVTVSDGRLTISNGAGASNNKLCFVEIVRVG